MKRGIYAVLVILFILLLCGCEVFEQKEDIIILYTNDVASALGNEDIGYEGVKGYKDYLENENNYVSLVDAGDFLDGTISVRSNGQEIVDIMNAVGYDVAAVGNQEFSIGLDHLAEAIERSDFDYVSCNLKYLGSGKDPLNRVRPYVIKSYGWTKIAFIGVTTPETDIPGKPAYDAISQDGELLYDFYGANEGQELYDQVQRTVNKVRNKADYVIVLAHLGQNSVRKGFSSYDLIANTRGIDVVIDGHSHTMNSGEGVANIDGEMVVLTSTGQKLENLGVLYIHPNHTYTTVLYPYIYEKDAGVKSLVDEILSR